MNANDEIIERYRKAREAFRLKEEAQREAVEAKLAKSIYWNQQGVIKPYHVKGWRCLHCPGKKLNQGKDVDNHIESKAHQENLMLSRLAK